MKKFEVLCVTMNQKDFSLYDTMHLESDAVFANQTDEMGFVTDSVSGHEVSMYSTTTRGVGINRNISLLHATAEICLLSDDDMVYRKGYEEEIIEEFNKHPNADVIIFNIGTTTPQYGRIPTVTKKFKRMYPWSRNPYGAPRIAFRLASVRKANTVFSTFFGGGGIYTNGEDTIWIEQLMRRGLKVYLSPVFIGDVSYEQSSWNEADYRKKCYSFGAILEAKQTRFKLIYILYNAFMRKHGSLSPWQVMRLNLQGIKGYKRLISYDEFKKIMLKRGNES